MTTTTKLTKEVALTKAIEALTGKEGFEEVCTKLDAMREQVVKEAHRDHKAGPKAQAEAAAKEAFVAQVREFIAAHPQTTAKEIATAFEVTPQKVTGALRKLVVAGEVKREEVKGKAIFMVA